MDPLVFAGFIQGYHYCLDDLMRLANYSKPKTVEATFEPQN